VTRHHAPLGAKARADIAKGTLNRSRQRLLAKWLVSVGGRWSGSASELLLVLRSFATDAEARSALPADEDEVLEAVKVSRVALGRLGWSVSWPKPGEFITFEGRRGAFIDPMNRPRW
jgi:hypothetical protein